jgi:hypothetical protein
MSCSACTTHRRSHTRATARLSRYVEDARRFLATWVVANQHFRPSRCLRWEAQQSGCRQRRSTLRPDIIVTCEAPLAISARCGHSFTLQKVECLQRSVVVYLVHDQEPDRLVARYAL